jgi:hypothetical protein
MTDRFDYCGLSGTHLTVKSKDLSSLSQAEESGSSLMQMRFIFN